MVISIEIDTPTGVCRFHITERWVAKELSRGFICAGVLVNNVNAREVNA